MSRQPPFRVDCTFRNDTLLFNVHFWCVTPMSRIPEREPIPLWTHPRRPGCMEDTVGSFGLVPQKIYSRTILLASFSTRGSIRNKFCTIEKKKILGGRRAQVSAAKVNAATHEMWEAVGLRNSSPRINHLFAELMRGDLVNERHPHQGLNLLQRMGHLPALGQIFLPQNQFFLAAELSASQDDLVNFLQTTTLKFAAYQADFVHQKKTC